MGLICKNEIPSEMSARRPYDRKNDAELSKPASLRLFQSLMCGDNHPSHSPGEAGVAMEQANEPYVRFRNYGSYSNSIVSHGDQE